jgi:hypothetical protein
MKTRLYPLMAFFIIPVISCTNNHLIKDSDYLDKVNDKFLERREIFSGSENELFSVFNEDMNQQESEALKFLFAYMPLSDLADYHGLFFLENIKLSLKAHEQTDWKKSIPENIFLHYVLPIRVNNENLDSFRINYYDEIIDRIGDYAETKIVDKCQPGMCFRQWDCILLIQQMEDMFLAAPCSMKLS